MAKEEFVKVWSLSGGIAAKLEINSIPSKKDQEFLKLCLERALDELKEIEETKSAMTITIRQFLAQLHADAVPQLCHLNIADWLWEHFKFDDNGAHFFNTQRCVYCGRPANSTDGIPVCQPYCFEESARGDGKD